LAYIISNMDSIKSLKESKKMLFNGKFLKS